MNRRELMQRVAAAPLALLGAACCRKAEAAPLAVVVENFIIATDSNVIAYHNGVALAIEFTRNGVKQAVVVNKKTKIYIDGERQDFRSLINEAYARPLNFTRLFQGSLATIRLKTVILASRVDISFS